ncbi:hypothetical protein C8Q78DRAFT_1020432 [Trametes maxima]|nr:hypothetical protein C8Q78DRAFT_1020432 [Trametes maxima]
MNAELLAKCIHFAEHYNETRRADDEDEIAISQTTTASTAFSMLSLGRDAPTSATSLEADSDPRAVSQVEALSYYAGLPSEPRLIYRTGKPWVPPSGPEAQRRTKELRPVFNHSIVGLWSNGLAFEVVALMEKHKIIFTSIDVVRFLTVGVDEDAGEEPIGPVTLWIGAYIDHTPPSLAYKAAQDVLVLLGGHGLTDIDVDFRGSVVTREIGPRLLRPVSDLDPVVDVVGPLTPALGLRISTTARPNAQGTMSLYLDDGDGNLLGLSCRHVLLGPNEGNLDYEYHPYAPAKNVVHLGKRAFTDLVDSIRLRIGRHGIAIRRWQNQIPGFVARENGTDALDAAKAAADRVKTEGLIQEAEQAVPALGALLYDVKTHWKKLKDRILGPIVRSPAIRLGVGAERFTEDWGVFRLDRAKLGDGFQGNKIDLGVDISPEDFTVMCFPHGDANWHFEYPVDRLLPLRGTLSLELMRQPDMWESDGEPCLLVVKCGNATNTTIGRANGVFSVVRDYFSGNMAIHQTSMEWAILNYDSKSEVFSKPGDSGSIIADIRGRIGGMLTGGAGMTGSSDMTYATPFNWVLERIKANGFPNVNVNVNAD